MRDLRILLADDDTDDCMFFHDALEDLRLPATLKTIHDGVQLMHYLSVNADNLPDVLFLDLNMPRKSGFECLTEIKLIAELTQLPVIIFSTSFDPEIVELLYKKGAWLYIRKPGEFGKLKEIINKALGLIDHNNTAQPPWHNFVLHS